MEKLEVLHPYGFFFFLTTHWLSLSCLFFLKKKKKSSSRKGQRKYQALVVSSISTALMVWPELGNAFNYCTLLWIWKLRLWEAYVYYIINRTVFQATSCMLADCSSRRYFLILSQNLPSHLHCALRECSSKLSSWQYFFTYLMFWQYLPFAKNQESFSFTSSFGTAVLLRRIWFGKHTVI